MLRPELSSSLLLARFSFELAWKKPRTNQSCAVPTTVMHPPFNMQIMHCSCVWISDEQTDPHNGQQAFWKTLSVTCQNSPGSFVFFPWTAPWCIRLSLSFCKLNSVCLVYRRLCLLVCMLSVSIRLCLYSRCSLSVSACLIACLYAVCPCLSVCLYSRCSLSVFQSVYILSVCPYSRCSLSLLSCCLYIRCLSACLYIYCLSPCLSIYCLSLSVCPHSRCSLSLSACLPVYMLSVCLQSLCCLSVWLPIFPLLPVSVCLPVYMLSLSVCLTAYIPVAPWLCLPVCLYAVSVCLFVCLSDCLYSRCSLSLPACLSICCLCLCVCVCLYSCCSLTLSACLSVFCLSLPVYIPVSPCLSLSVSPGPTLTEHAVIRSGLLGATEANGTSTCSDHHGQVRVRLRHDVIVYEYVVFGTACSVPISIFSFVNALLAHRAQELCEGRGRPSWALRS